MNKTIYLCLSILKIRKPVMYEFWYDYIKLKHQDKGNLCYLKSDSHIVNTKADY